MISQLFAFNFIFLADGANFIADFVNTEDHRKRPFRYDFFFALRFFISSQNSRVVMSSLRSSQKVL